MTRQPTNSKITDVRLGEARLYGNAIGDTWDPAWAEDGNLYSPGNDGSGWDQVCAGNVFFNQTSGDDFRQLAGKTLGMPEYGGWAQEGPDGCTWKSSGCISIDGVLYFGVARHRYGTKSGDAHLRQTAQRASLIKSADHGMTWMRPAQENYENPMFPGPRFATPYFIYYGQDGKAPAVDRADQYIYAVSNNGFWCNGDNYILGRVERARIGRLTGSDWEFYTGGDGLLNGSWSRDMDRATLIIDNPLKCGETGATYLPAFGRYILVAWYYPGDPNVETDETRFIYYEAPKPWGPWNKVKEDVIRPEGWYCPRVLAKWQKARDGEVEAVLATGGDYYEMARYYRFTVVPVQIKNQGMYSALPAQAEPVTVGNDKAGDGLNEFHYEGSWEVQASRGKAFNGQERFSAKEGDWFTIRFNGSRLKWYSSKENTMGMAAVSLDGGEETLVDLYTYCHVAQFGRLLYDSGPLKAGAHTFKVRVTGQKNTKSSGIFIYNQRVEVFE